MITIHFRVEYAGKARNFLVFPRKLFTSKKVTELQLHFELGAQSLTKWKRNFPMRKREKAFQPNKVNKDAILYFNFEFLM